MSYIIPIGPYHPSLEEPIHAKLYTEGEVIKDAEVFVGYNHRGIEKLATERNAIQTLVLVEQNSNGSIPTCSGWASPAI